MAIRSGRIPPTLHFAAPNPLIDFGKASIQVADRATEWPKTDHPRRAGVTSLGIGGTNAHVVLEEAPALEMPLSSRPCHVLTVSARTAETLEEATRDLGQYLRRQPDLCPDDVAYTLHVGRREFPHRRAVVCRDLQHAVKSIDSLDPAFVVSAEAAKTKHSVAFLFPGQGSQYVGMGSQIYAAEPVFRQWIDRCAELASEWLGFDFREMLYPRPEHADTARESIAQTWNTQPTLRPVWRGYSHSRTGSSWCARGAP
jgi:acyl transferase domain-containing protein